MDVLKKINALRLGRGWSLYKLSEKSGVPQSTISNMFVRETLPSLTTLEMLCDALGVSMASFFTEETAAITADELMLVEQYRTLDAEEQAAVRNLLAVMRKK